MAADPMVNMLAKKFIQRTDVKAKQTADGYFPVTDGSNSDPVKYLGWKRPDLEAHLAGTETYGHYLLDQDDTCKLFAFDIDLEEKGTWCTWPEELPEDRDITDEDYGIFPGEPRNDWHDRAHPGRAWYKYQLRHMAEMLSSRIARDLGLSTACAYSGNKGIHVYGFTGPIKAADAREGGLIVLDSLDCFEAKAGKSKYIHKDEGPVQGFRNLTIELFPKQDSLEGKKLGNLLRLPLGVNRKHTKDKTFFLDQTAPATVLAPHPDPVALLESGNPWL